MSAVPAQAASAQNTRFRLRAAGLYALMTPRPTGELI
jgi:hypothetical protein